MFWKNKIMSMLTIACMLGLIGCGDTSSVSLEQALLAAEKGTEAESVAQGTDEGVLSVLTGIISTGDEAAGADNTDMAENSNVGREEAAPTVQLLYVYVCGEVVEPGVYALEEGKRIVAAVEAAGGFTKEAATEAVNLAALLQDGMQIVVPNEEEHAVGQALEERQKSGQINLNTATVEELCTLSGIGEAKAEAIMAYRTEIGAFTSIEQLHNVSGIGDSLFNQIKNSIYIE